MNDARVLSSTQQHTLDTIEMVWHDARVLSSTCADADFFEMIAQTARAESYKLHLKQMRKLFEEAYDIIHSNDPNTYHRWIADAERMLADTSDVADANTMK
jgi:hypothetical protein